MKRFQDDSSGRCAPRLAGAAALMVALCTSPARALELGFAVHAEGAAARMVGEGKQDQFGWGGGGLAAPELTLGHHIGVELPIGAVGLSDGARDEMGLAPTRAGYGVFALPGLRLRPFGRDAEGGPLQAGGVWLAGGGGMAYTGGLPRGAMDVRVGYDFLSDQSLRVGPTVGFLQIVQPNDTVRSQDARVVMLGFHAAFEPVRRAAVDDDRDDDGIVNATDLCPDDPEDFDDWQDRDGCPDSDNDGDGILDMVDECPIDAEDKDGYRDEDGCPDPDNDDDGFLDKNDGCPNQAEDIDGFDDEDGCPDDDNDGDGIFDLTDKCPLDPETVNGYADDDGCPDDGQVRVVGNEILLDDRVHFHVNSDAIRPRSWPLLQNVAKLLNAHEQYTRVRVQGHADDSGTEEYNQALSERRGRAVRDMLVHFGVDRDRLVVDAFGESRPRVDEATVYARTKNRRVEFLILERREVEKTVTPIRDLLPPEDQR